MFRMITSCVYGAGLGIICSGGAANYYHGDNKVVKCLVGVTGLIGGLLLTAATADAACDWVENVKDSIVDR